MKQKQRGDVEKRPSAVSSVSQSHFLSLLSGFFGEKVDCGSQFIFCFERKEAQEHQGRWGIRGGGEVIKVKKMETAVE